MALLDCATNTATVEWTASTGADSYVVQAFATKGDETCCETTSRSCVLPDLLCGFTYNVSVIATNGVCNVSQSDIKQLQAGTDNCFYLKSMKNNYLHQILQFFGA